MTRFQALDGGCNRANVIGRTAAARANDAGASAHEAFDAVPMVGGKPQWQTEAPQWQTYGKAVMAAGLVWAGTWTEFREYPHAQLRAGSNPLKVLTAAQVREALGI